MHLALDQLGPRFKELLFLLPPLYGGLILSFCTETFSQQHKQAPSIITKGKKPPPPPRALKEKSGKIMFDPTLGKCPFMKPSKARETGSVWLEHMPLWVGVEDVMAH